MDWLSFACEEQCKMNDILKIYQDCNEHILIVNVRGHLQWIGCTIQYNYNAIMQ